MGKLMLDNKVMGQINMWIVILFNPISLILYFIIWHYVPVLLLTIWHIINTKINRIKFQNVQYNRDLNIDPLVYYSGLLGALGIKCNFISYILLDFVKKKWLEYERVDIDKYVYKLGNVKPSFNDNPIIEELYFIILYAMGDDYILNQKELLKYVNSMTGQLRLDYLQDLVEAKSCQYFWDNNYVKHTILNEKACKYGGYHFLASSFTKKGFEILKSVYGIYKYIQDYTLLKEKGIEVESYWENLLDDRIKQKTVSDIQQTYKKHLKIAKELYNKKFGE